MGVPARARSARNIDIQAVKLSEEKAVFIEVKSFHESESPVEMLTHALGRYMPYRMALDAVGDSSALYLAIPQSAYSGIFNEPVGLMAVNSVSMQIVVYDAEAEVITQWITR
jgi:hypothetical protein